jgi:hypothetical protein
MDRVERGRQIAHRLSLAPGEQLKLEMVWRDDIGGSERARLDEFRNAGTDEDAAADIADHRIAAIERARPRGLHPGDRIEDRFADRGIAHVAGEHAVAARQRATLLDAGDDLAHRIAGEHAALPGAIAGVVRKLHRVDGPDLVAEPLHRKHRSGVADVTVRHPGLDREDVHDGIGA